MRLSLSALLGTVDLGNRTASRLLKGVAGAVLVFLYVPILVVVMLSFTPQQTPSFPMPGVSLRWYEALVTNSDLIDALLFSLQLAVVSAFGSGLVGSLAGFGLVRGDYRNSVLDESTLRMLFSIPIIIPFIITGIGGLVFFNVLGIYGSWPSLVVGHILITLPFTTLVIAAGLDGFDESLEEAAKNLGATQVRAYLEVTLPTILPSIVAAMLFAFILSFNNFIQTFFWLSFGDQTLPVVIYALVQRTYDPTLNAIGAVIIVGSLALTIAAERLSGRVVS
ncbi:ABC transporter permease [Halogeometricum sp. CBA1124]|uniref:ABC transporter permease n=1 Tax=Halogeometricum sp. CBA1124 TaxID=2668071 RepID=UPI00142BBAD4|nr:ABC transporter permease [Halogeometricum sp. CBA1124]MUV56179.1 ABC transporter permease subunit [Halogeometricum sp. CBA1124]